MPMIVRVNILKLLGVEIGKSNIVCSGLELRSNKLILGNNVLINKNCHFYNDETITIADNCKIAYDVKILTASHKIGGVQQRCGETYYATVNIEEGCWIGAGVTILPGVSIKKGCVIGAGSLVNKDCEENGLYVGIPARRIRNLS